MVQASLRALEDCGLRVADVDGLFAATTQLPMAPLNLGEAARRAPRATPTPPRSAARRSSSTSTTRAPRSRPGLCEVALIAYGSTQRSVGRGSASVQEIDPYEAPYRPPLPVAAYALAAARHMHEFGTTREQLAAVAVSARATGRSDNPRAWSRDPLTVDDVLGRPHGRATR